MFLNEIYKCYWYRWGEEKGSEIINMDKCKRRKSLSIWYVGEW